MEDKKFTLLPYDIKYDKIHDNITGGFARPKS